VPRYQRRIFGRPIRHRFYGGVTLLAHLATVFGLPMPAVATKPNSEPFPCQHHACGCLSAEQCWRSCCCFTPEQRWAWAKEHQVQPPSYAEKPTGQGWRSPRKRDRVESRQETPLPPCCVRAQEKQKTPACKDAKRQAGPGWTIVVMAQRCQALTSLWVTSGAALPATRPISWTPCLAPVEWLATAQVIPSPSFKALLDPPPRRV
jgi:hypothetical protein